jgi:hypothetical protein
MLRLSGCEGAAVVIEVDGTAVKFEFFPYGYLRQACKIAGMRRPRAWSTG